jgi:hypothetical protein
MYISLDGLSLINVGKDPIDLKGVYNSDTISKLMIENWIPSFECHKCGKWDYCKYAQKHPANPNRSVDIQCGIAIDFVRNYVSTTFSMIDELSTHEKQAYLNSAYYLTCYAQNSEQLIGTFISEEHLMYWGEYAPSIYGMSKDISNLLASAHKEMKNVPFFKSQKSIVFVEGESEEIFANHFLDIEVKCYEGNGRLKYSKIESHFRDYTERGYNIYLQADNDGKKENQDVKKIIDKGLLLEENVFCFKHDFETAIPVHIFHQILIDNKLIDDTFDDFINEYDRRSSIVKYTEFKYDIKLRKPFLATKLCEFIDASSRYSNLYYEEAFLKTEIGQFWYFLKTKIVD